MSPAPSFNADEFNQALGLVCLLVRDYDEAIDFFTGKLGFEIVEDTPVHAQHKRWVVIKPAGSQGARILLAQANAPEQRDALGNQTGGRVFLFLYTDDFWRDYKRYRDAGVEFVRVPEQLPYGIVAVFKDLHGNKWDLIQPGFNNSSWQFQH